MSFLQCKYGASEEQGNFEEYPRVRELKVLKLKRQKSSKEPGGVRLFNSREAQRCGAFGNLTFERSQRTITKAVWDDNSC